MVREQLVATFAHAADSLVTVLLNNALKTIRDSVEVAAMVQIVSGRLIIVQMIITRQRFIGLVHIRQRNIGHFSERMIPDPS